jgi:hypothetical protein
LPGEPGAEDVLGLWGSGPPDVLAAGAAEAGSLWLAGLPGDPAAAGALLEAQQRQVAALGRALPRAQARLLADLSGLAASGPDELSFALEQAPADAPLGVLAGALRYRYPDQAASFGLFDAFKPDRQQVEESVGLFDRFSRQVRQTFEGLALVETVIGGRRLGRTSAGWSGDMETWWAAGGLPDERRQHAQVLAQALATRQHWLRFFLLVAGGIPRVAGALAAGPFAPVAIWATWNYFQQVIQAFRKALNAQLGK